MSLACQWVYKFKCTSEFNIDCWVVYTGPRKRMNYADADLSTLNTDDLVAVYCKKIMLESL